MKDRAWSRERLLLVKRGGRVETVAARKRRDCTRFQEQKKESRHSCGLWRGARATSEAQSYAHAPTWLFREREAWPENGKHEEEERANETEAGRNSNERIQWANRSECPAWFRWKSLSFIFFFLLFPFFSPFHSLTRICIDCNLTMEMARSMIRDIGVQVYARPLHWVRCFSLFAVEFISKWTFVDGNWVAMPGNLMEWKGTLWIIWYAIVQDWKIGNRWEDVIGAHARLIDTSEI